MMDTTLPIKVEYVVKDRLERKVVELVRKHRAKEKSCIITVKLNSDGTWQLFTGEPVVSE